MDEAGRGLVVRVACLPARAEASHRSEMVTQWLCGETVAPRERREDWVHCVGPDGYEAWCSAGGFTRATDGASWARRATLFSLGCTARPVDGPFAGGRAPIRLWLPFGSRVAPAPDGALSLPDGTIARPRHPQAIVASEERARRFPPRPAPLVETARRWIGVPYLWGGRTERGTDCSGLVQAVFRLHGVRLPRDSAPQSGVGRPVEASGALAFRAGDLLFFGPEDRVTHVALSTGGSSVLHAADANGAVWEEDLASETPFARRLRERFRLARRPLAPPGSADES